MLIWSTQLLKFTDWVGSSEEEKRELFPKAAHEVGLPRNDSEVPQRSKLPLVAAAMCGYVVVIVVQ